MKLKFPKDTYYNGKLLYKAGEIYEVTESLGFAERWLKRGAEQVVVETIENPIENLVDNSESKVIEQTSPKPRGRKNKKSVSVGEL